ncbi:MAG: hypothetical protein NVSMB4_07350 [Acidimicrobiales bacterium]
MSELDHCVYPGCRGMDGKPRLTYHGVCGTCQPRFRRTLWWLVLDWVNLTTNWPSPAAGTSGRRATHTVYGHPAEWASETATEIADLLGEIHDALAEHLGHRRPPPSTSADRVRVRAWWQFVDARIPALCAWDNAHDTAVEVGDLHGRIRSQLGHNRPRYLLTGVRCTGCEARQLYRIVDAGRDWVECAECGQETHEEQYGLLARRVLDDLIEAEDEQVATGVREHPGRAWVAGIVDAADGAA